MRHLQEATWIAGPFLIVGMLCAACLVVPAVQAQDNGNSRAKVSRYDLPRVYREARFRRLFLQYLAEHGPGADPLPPEPMTSSMDSMLHWLDTMHPDYVPPPPEVEPLTINTWKQYRRLERNTFNQRFKHVNWAYLGGNHFTYVDTSFTRILRARMQKRFGAPTKTLVELDYSRNLQQEEYIQFEYWFVLNDSIPFIVMDVNGPFDRGFVIMSDEKYRDHLLTLRQQFLGDLYEDSPAPYVDYYYDYRRRQWYRTGFDGRRFFTFAIGQPNLAAGRPQLPPPGQ